MSRFREGKLRFFNHDPSGPHSVRAIIDHATVTATPLIASAPVAVSGIVGQTFQFGATAFDALGNVIAGVSASWSVDNDSIASITQAGLVTFARVGTVNVTATVDGRAYPTVVSVSVSATPQDGSLTDLRTTIGDENIVSVWAFDTNVTTDGSGHVTQVDDARGIAYGPSLLGFGGTKPAYDAVHKTITTDGSQNYMATTAHTLYGLARDRTRVLAYIGDARATGSTIFPVFMSANGNAPYMGLMVTSSGFVDGVFNPGSSPSAQEGTSPSAVFNEPGTTQGRLWIIERHARYDARDEGTLNQQACGYHFPGRVRHLRGDGGLAAADADGTSFVSMGLLPPTNFYPTTGWGKVVLSADPPPSWRAALARFSARLVGAATTVTNPLKRIVELGDSITQGGPGVSDQAHSYPAQVQASPGIAGAYEVSNRGVSSRTLVEMAQASLGGNGLWFDQALADLQPGDTVTLMICTNDLGSISVPNVLLPLYIMLGDAVLRTGAQFIPITVLRRGSLTGSGETDRQTLNAALKLMPSQGHATKCCDAASNPFLQDPADTLYFVDQTHLTDLGCSKVAADVVATILAAGG